jgi:catechol 2,3-dioxygenase-like lactoylglutathione lyase family enzyme
MRVTHVRNATVAATDPERLAAFYADVWGLARVGASSGVTYLRGGGPENHILRVTGSDRTRLAGYAAGLPDRAAVDAAADELSKLPGICFLSGPEELTSPGGGYGIVIADVDGRRVELSADVAPAEGSYDADVKPTKISHVVINSPHADAYDGFLREVLGFTLADEMPHMKFYRCSTDHHSIAICPAPHASLNHIAFEVPTTADVLRGIDHLGSSVPLIWGPNRHGPGNNVFAYFVAPNDQVIEYTAEVQQIDAAAAPAPRMWLPEEWRVADEWAEQATLRPVPEARTAMLGAPEDELVPASTL